MNVEKIIKEYEYLYGHHIIVSDYIEISPSHYKVKLREQTLQYFVDIIYEDDKINIINSDGKNLLDMYPKKQLEKFQKGVINYA